MKPPQLTTDWRAASFRMNGRHQTPPTPSLVIHELMDYHRADLNELNTPTIPVWRNLRLNHLNCETKSGVCGCLRQVSISSGAIRGLSPRCAEIHKLNASRRVLLPLKLEGPGHTEFIRVGFGLDNMSDGNVQCKAARFRAPFLGSIPGSIECVHTLGSPLYVTGLSMWSLVPCMSNA
ncbi:hypothetical protein BDM02DRAFT_1359508 [Thelephora ganbajun]|uniref:Uncharacterized protein n=1 Tax=Thelephora ganbajun TaxID=370292 RepID=A0ACB6Z2Q2_THEGA|nr:hypothetical protein BDM02DRAFT_1359508 [Thelephora ganbajun]